VPIVGVAWFGDERSMQGFVDRHGLSFPNLNDQPGDVFGRFEVPGQPAWVFIGADGTVTRRLGVLDDAALDTALAATRSP
jgi:hypothetical protein